jgi:predicted aspartyl protease
MVFLLSGSLYAQVPGFFMKKNSRRVVVPFSQVNNLIIIPVSINGGPPLNFLFDTGVKSNILFSKSIGNQLGMTYSRKLNLVGADGQTVLTASVSTNNHLDMGDIEGTMQAVLVLEEDFLELEKVIGVPVFGVIGYEFFKYNPIKIDYDSNRLSFYKTSAFKSRPFGYRIMDFILDDSKPYIVSKIRQIQGPDLEAKLLIDTGANHSLLLNKETSEDIVLPPVALETDLGRSLGGDLFGFIGRVNHLTIGNLKFRNVLTSYPNETEFSNIILGTGRLGSLGSELLSRLKLILDYPRQRILYRKAATFSQPFAYDMSGITVRLISVDESRVYVSQVREDSPAFKGGVQPFDEISSINKIPIDFWKLSHINDLFRSEEGRLITLGILRNTSDEVKEFTISFVLEKQL